MKKIVSLLLCMMLLVGLCFALASCQCKHEYGEPVITEPTCTEAGYETYTCTKCGETKVENPESLAATGHTPAADGTVVTEATCIVPGVMSYACVNCDATAKHEEIPATGHDYKVEKNENTHSEICANCGDAKLEEGAHTFGDPVTETAATCTDDGLAKKTCTVCGYVASVVLPATGHTVSGDDIVTQPTAGNCLPGMTYKVCSVCQEKVVTEWRPSDVGHSFVVDTSKLSEEDHTTTHNGAIGKLIFTCTECEVSYTVDATYAYNFDNDCFCGYNYNGANVAADSTITVSAEGGYLSFIGTVAGANVVSNQQIYAATPDQLADQNKIVMGVDISMPEAGLPEMGYEFISKLSGWKNPKVGLKIDADGTIKVGGEAVGKLVAGEFTNFVISMEIAEEANAAGKYPVTVNYWIDGHYIATTETSEPMDTATFQADGNTYIQWKIAKADSNVDPERGVLLDNVFVAYELPAGFVTSALPKHTCEAEAGAALQYDANGHYNVCKTCGAPMNVTAHTLGEEKTDAPVAGTCTPGMTYQACDCGYKKITATTPSDTQHTFVVDTSKLSAADHTATGHAAAGKVTFTCSECDMSYTVDTIQMITFDDCVCGLKYDAGPSILPADQVAEGMTPVSVTTNGTLTIIGAMRHEDTDEDGKWTSGKDAPGTMKNNLDTRYIGSASLAENKLANDKFAVIGFSVTMPEGGFPESGADLNLKFNGAWVNSGLRFANAAVSFNGTSLAMTANVPVNVVVTIDVTTEGKLLWNVWVDGLWLGEVVKTDAKITGGFSGNNQTYGNFTVNGNNVTNVDPNRGIIYDNFFWADAIPEGFVAEKYVAPATPVEPAPAA